MRNKDKSLKHSYEASSFDDTIWMLTSYIQQTKISKTDNDSGSYTMGIQ